MEVPRERPRHGEVRPDARLARRAAEDVSMQLGIDGAKKRREEFEGVQGGLEGGARAVSKVEEREALARRARDAFVVEDERHDGGDVVEALVVGDEPRGVGVVRAHGGVDDAAEDVASRVAVAVGPSVGEWPEGTRDVGVDDGGVRVVAREGVVVGVVVDRREVDAEEARPREAARGGVH